MKTNENEILTLTKRFESLIKLNETNEIIYKDKYTTIHMRKVMDDIYEVNCDLGNLIKCNLVITVAYLLPQEINPETFEFKMVKEIIFEKIKMQLLN